MIQSDPSAANLGLCNVKSLSVMVASGVVLGMQICFLTVLTRYVLIWLYAGRAHNPVSRDDVSESRGQRGTTRMSRQDATADTRESEDDTRPTVLTQEEEEENNYNDNELRRYRAPKYTPSCLHMRYSKIRTKE